MLSMLFMLIMGWPGILTSLGLSLAGIVRKQPILLIIGALIAIPFAWYVNNAPALNGLGILLPLLHVGAAVAVLRGWRWIAGLCLLPFISVTTWLAVAVLTQ